MKKWDAEHVAMKSFGNSEQLIKHQSNNQGSDGNASGDEIKKPSSNEPVTLIKPVADLYGITSPTGSETTFTFDAVEASSFVGSGWHVQEYVELERYQEAMTANSPATPDGWIMVPKVPTEAMCETGHIGVDVYTGLATEGDGYYSIGGEDAARVWEFMIAMSPKQENTMDYITKLSPKLVSVGMFEQLSFHDGFSLKCRELGIHASKLGHIELSKKAQDLMLSASLQQHDQLVDNMASLIELMADSYMRNTANSPVTPDAWIPVSERMPEDEQEVLTRNRMGHCFVSFFDEHSGLFFDRVDVAAACCIEHILVTHWMPLPAAPQQEE
ncbi:TPA: DUF551 domain-containing protein [Citrobacter freundii]